MKILYIMSSYNIYGGTPKKTLDLLKHFKDKSSLYVYGDNYKEFKPQFERAGAHIYEGAYGRNLYKHVSKLLKIIDDDKIDIVQTQFTMGESLGYLVKLLRPNIKLIVAFVGPFGPTGIKKLVTQKIYTKVDQFVFITKYVKQKKEEQFPILLKKSSKIIFNGTEKRQLTNDDFPNMKHTSLYSSSGLVDCKNIDVLVEALNILKQKGNSEVFLYVAGDGPERESLQTKIHQYNLEHQVFLLGYQKNIGALLEHADIYVHPAYAEGFGIAVAEAMMAEKPMIVANAGAMPELIESNKSGLLVDPFNADAWSEAIIKLIEDKKLANKLGENAKTRAKNEFSIDKYVANYGDLYKELLNQK